MFASKAHGGIAGQWPEHKLSNPQLLCGEGSLAALRKRGWEGTAKAQVQVPDNPSWVEMK